MQLGTIQLQQVIQSQLQAIKIIEIILKDDQSDGQWFHFTADVIADVVWIHSQMNPSVTCDDKIVVPIRFLSEGCWVRAFGGCAGGTIRSFRCARALRQLQCFLALAAQPLNIHTV